MYGTVARLRTKPGMGQRLRDLTASYDDVLVPGFIASYVYRSDANENEYWMAVMFQDRDSYHKNAGDPAQDARYHQMRELLTEDPEWHDGEIVSGPS